MRKNIKRMSTHACHYKMHGTGDTHTLTMSTQAKNMQIQSIPKYRVTETSEMLPLQKLDEE